MEIVQKFHGYAAPGVLIGGVMVDRAVKDLPGGILYYAVCETRFCLPDAVQLLTPCTIGNGWLKVLHSGRYALTLYGKETNEGVRVSLDAEKVEPWGHIKTWYLKLKPKQEQDRERLVAEIREAGADVMDIRRVRIDSRFAGKRHKGQIAICPQCREAYPADDGRVCLACQGETPYLLP
jgi:formylmethanofuran dehydrogenase subunit E